MSLCRARVDFQRLLESFRCSGEILLFSQRDTEEVEALDALGRQLEAGADFRLR